MKGSDVCIVCKAFNFSSLRGTTGHIVSVNLLGVFLSDLVAIPTIMFHYMHAFKGPAMKCSRHQLYRTRLERRAGRILSRHRTPMSFAGLTRTQVLREDIPMFIEFKGDKKSAVRNVVKPDGKASAHFAFILHRARATVVRLLDCFQSVDKVWSFCVICRGAPSCESARAGPATGQPYRQYAF